MQYFQDYSTLSANSNNNNIVSGLKQPTSEDRINQECDIILLWKQNDKTRVVSSTRLFSRKTKILLCVSRACASTDCFTSTITAARSEFSMGNVYEASRSSIFINAVIRACASFKAAIHFLSLLMSA